LALAVTLTVPRLRDRSSQSLHFSFCLPSPALLGVELCVYVVATILFLTVERPFLQLPTELPGVNLLQDARSLADL
jgi:hypothetical protein